MLKSIITCILLISCTQFTYGLQKECKQQIQITPNNLEQFISTFNQFETQLLDINQSSTLFKSQPGDITRCTRIYSRCLDDIRESGEYCGYCYPGGSIIYFARVMFCAGRYNDCASNRA